MGCQQQVHLLASSVNLLHIDDVDLLHADDFMADDVDPKKRSEGATGLQTVEQDSLFSFLWQMNENLKVDAIPPSSMQCHL